MRERTHALLGVSLDGRAVRVRVPVGRADLAVLVGELESLTFEGNEKSGEQWSEANVRVRRMTDLDESNSLLYGSTDGKVVDGDLSEGSLGVDQEETSEGDSLILHMCQRIGGRERRRK